MPNSILWIGLVVLWVFVLFPILADRHPRIRRTTDTALATRVLHRGDSKRRKGSGYVRKKRSGRSHRKRHHGNDAEDRMTTTAEETVAETEEEHLDTGAGDHGPDDEGFDDIGDTGDTGFAETADDTGVDSGGDIAADNETAPSFEDAAPARIPPVRVNARRAPAPETAADESEFVPSRRGRGGYDPEADAIARAARYTFRQRAVVALILGAVLCGGLAVAISPLLWWGCGGAALSLIAYLVYLRKQVRIEQEIRRRRSARLADRDQMPAAESADSDETGQVPAARPGMDRDTARALRRRSQLLERDDEDPAFEHLDAYDATIARTVRHRASGGDVRRAAGA
ncbi:gephyrin-like molybdotransferase receptor GlpR [Nocardia sp. NPDC019395]|uniref:divisome protein SepX/GlpR n=1 Tax=Nocardia sp. NPDC019395 TaxID=3154686 RepID=UPI0033EDC898